MATNSHDICATPPHSTAFVLQPFLRGRPRCITKEFRLLTPTQAGKQRQGQCCPKVENYLPYPVDASNACTS